MEAICGWKPCESAIMPIKFHTFGYLETATETSLTNKHMHVNIHEHKQTHQQLNRCSNTKLLKL